MNAHARIVSAPPVEFGLATPADEPALRRLLRDNPMPGRIVVGLEREPDFLAAPYLEGPFHQTVVARARGTGEIVGMGSRAVRPMYVNSLVRDVGYLGQLRADLGRAWGLSLGRYVVRGHRFLRELHDDARAPLYLTSIVADNSAARRLLEARLPGMPHYVPFARILTYVIAPRRASGSSPLSRDLRLGRGSPDHVPAILDCLRRNGMRRQFSPVWSRRTLFSESATPDLAPEDFFLALDGDRVVGCLALWDQSRFKQVVIRGYAGAIARGRWAINLLAALTGYPTLPPAPSALRYAYLSHLAIDDDDPRVAAALLHAANTAAAERGYRYLMVGLSERDPLRPAIESRYRRLTYTTQLYLVAWDDGIDGIGAPDGRVPAAEIAVL